MHWCIQIWHMHVMPAYARSSCFSSLNSRENKNKFCLHYSNSKLGLWTFHIFVDQNVAPPFYQHANTISKGAMLKKQHCGMTQQWEQKWLRSNIKTLETLAMASIITSHCSFLYIWTGQQGYKCHDTLRNRLCYEKTCRHSFHCAQTT